MSRKISVIIGTRPEAIKLAPVVLELKRHPECECHVCVTAQHRQMLDQVLDVFEITPDVDLNLMQPNQSLAELTSRAIMGLSAYFEEHRPDLALVQGDTTSVFCAALAAFYSRVPVGHVEAGLRTWKKHSPFPEEVNRVLTTHLADIHFAPTERSRCNLEKEGVPAEKIHVTGNTVIDALLLAIERLKVKSPRIAALPDFLQPGSDDAGRRMVLITGHRRENFGAGFEGICCGIRTLAQMFPEVHFVYPVHLNPSVQEPVLRLLGDSRLPNVHLIEPLPYLPLVGLMKRCHLILTDSGGIQEEAPTLGKPVLVMRDTTERPEAIDAGVAKLVGTDANHIIQEVQHLLGQEEDYRNMARRQNPYGDGLASSRIVSRLINGSLSPEG
jgi:UDP-N-acetylglucosamine 2-epimerase (non-hydrolysing)